MLDLPPDIAQQYAVNRLLAGLPSLEQTKILNLCEKVELTAGTVLYEPDKKIQHVYFPTTAFISLVTTLREYQSLEIGLIGNEGMLGVTLALDVETAPMIAVVQGAGSALRMNADHMRQELIQNKLLSKILKRYLYVFIAQMAQTAACAHFHTIEARLSRWLLMTHDRAQGDVFFVTQEFLADMLGVRRSGITVAACSLQARNLIRYNRGRIYILNREGLKDSACECYEESKNNYVDYLENHLA